MPEEDYLGADHEGMYLPDGTFVPWNDNDLDEGTISVGDLFGAESTGTQIINPNPNSPKEIISKMSFTNKILSLGVLWIVLSTKAWK